MKEGIHPTYFPDATVTCACGNTWTTGSTKKELKIEICSQCHPYFSGELQRIVDIEGQVDRFYKKLQARQDYVEETKSRKSHASLLSAQFQSLKWESVPQKPWEWPGSAWSVNFWINWQKVKIRFWQLPVLAANH